MQIVIEISEELYEIAKGRVVYFTDRRWRNVVREKLFYEIANGIPLPKGHGDLVDRDLLQKRISEDKREAFTKHEVWLFASKYNLDLPILVPADKEEE